MPDVNYEWVRQQLQEAKIKVGSGNAVLQLLELWEKQTKLSPSLAKEAIEVFAKLALNHALLEAVVDPDEVWVPVQPGNIKVGEEVRVLKDAFSDEAGTIHNGRRGKVVAVRYGDIIFTSTDNKDPKLNGVHYSPYKLEKRVK
jgi:transcription antitermination factor NusG